MAVPGSVAGTAAPPAPPPLRSSPARPSLSPVRMPNALPARLCTGQDRGRSQASFHPGKYQVNVAHHPSGDLREAWSRPRGRAHMPAHRIDLPSAHLGLVRPREIRSTAQPLDPPLAYQSTRDLCRRYRCTSRTLFRRMNRADHPFPRPSIRHCGTENLWATEDVVSWERQEHERARQSYLIRPDDCASAPSP